MSWQFSDIGIHVEQISTWNPSQSLASNVFRYIDLSSIDKDNKVISLKDVPLISSTEAPSRARQLVKAKDVLVASVRPNLNGVAVVPEDLEDATASTGYCVLRADNSTLDFRYLYHWVKTNFFIEDMMKKATGANYPAVSDKIIKESKIPLPPLTEQKRIAAILDKADSLRRKNQQAILLADQFLRAVFLELFGDPVTNPKGWNIKPLGEMVKNLDGRRIPVKASDRAVLNGKYRYYGASGIIDQVDDYIFDERTLLIGEDGANLLARSTPIAFIVEGKYWVNNHAHVLAENGNLPLEYLMYSINMRSIAAYVTGSAQPKLNQEMLNKIPIQIPKQQLLDKFVKLIGIASNLKAKFSILPNEVLFNSLSQKAFAGEL